MKMLKFRLVESGSGSNAHIRAKVKVGLGWRWMKDQTQKGTVRAAKWPSEKEALIEVQRLANTCGSVPRVITTS